MARKMVCITVNEYESLKGQESIADYMLRRLGASLEDALAGRIKPFRPRRIYGRKT